MKPFLPTRVHQLLHGALMRLRRIARHESACRHIAGNAGTGGNHRLVADAHMIGHHADGERKVERPFSSRGMHERSISIAPLPSSRPASASTMSLVRTHSE